MRRGPMPQRHAGARAMRMTPAMHSTSPALERPRAFAPLMSSSGSLPTRAIYSEGQSLTSMLDAAMPDSITSGTPPPGFVHWPVRYRLSTTRER
jgi:hypothetical protein